MAQTANQIGVQAAGGPLTQTPLWKKGLQKAGQIANAWTQAGAGMGAGQGQQQPMQPVNFSVAPVPFIPPPPQMGPGFYGG
jgi:hypothetical protein